jgi:hypothetical protein
MVTLAVNTGENQSKYLDFTRSLSYSYVAWVWDQGGTVTDAYGVQGIPTTYILDQEGIVRHVHVGFSDSLGQTLAREIEALLD